MSLKELAKEIEIIKSNHLAHMQEDIDRIEAKIEKMDLRLWAILILLVGATIIGMIGL